MTAGKRKGRPPKADGVATMSLAMRLRPDAYERIRAEAELNGRSISAQAEQRVLRDDVDEVGRMISLVIAATEQREGKRWKDDTATRNKCRLAVDVVINTMLGPPIPMQRVRELVEMSKPVVDKLEKGEPLSVLDTLLTGGGPVLSADGLKEMAAVLTEAAEIQAIAEGKLEANGWGQE